MFVKLGYVGWAGIDAEALYTKCRPYIADLRENWKRLKVTHVRAGTGNGRELKKERWCDGLLYIAQDACMAEEMRVNRAVSRLAVMGFVKVTCSRSGAFGRDWADRAEKQLQWVGRNVLSVRDFTWHPDFMELEHVDEVELVDALRGEVELGRVKRHYYERVYKYQYSVTPENFDVARRAATWFAIYFWRRALFKVQYDGMSEAEVLEALRVRAAGHEGGMPKGAKISAAEAVRRWLAGERAYMRLRGDGGAVVDLSAEPMFVRLNGNMLFTTSEMNVEEAGAVYRELGDEMGVRPHASGVNSGRRNSAVAASQGLDREGMGQMLVKKLMQHRTSQGTTCFEAQYDDAPHSVDMGALMMGRTPEKVSALKSLLTTRVSDLVEIRRFSQLKQDDATRVTIFEGSEQRRQLKASIGLRKQAVKALEAKGASTAQVEVKLRAKEKELTNLEGRLRYETVEAKRWEVWEADFKAFDELTVAQLKARCTAEDVSAWRLEDLLVRYGEAHDHSTLITARDRKFAMLSALATRLTRWTCRPRRRQCSRLWATTR